MLLKVCEAEHRKGQGRLIAFYKIFLLSFALSHSQYPVNMHLNIPSLFFLSVSGILAAPVAEASPDISSLVSAILRPNSNKQAGPSKNNNCPSQQPTSQNVCSSGSPYCCSGTGSAQVCGPASSVACSSMTICCINTNGVSYFVVSEGIVLTSI